MGSPASAGKFLWLLIKIRYKVTDSLRPGSALGKKEKNSGAREKKKSASEAIRAGSLGRPVPPFPPLPRLDPG